MLVKYLAITPDRIADGGGRNAQSSPSSSDSDYDDMPDLIDDSQGRTQALRLPATPLRGHRFTAANINETIPEETGQEDEAEERDVGNNVSTSSVTEGDLKEKPPSLTQDASLASPSVEESKSSASLAAVDGNSPTNSSPRYVHPQRNQVLSASQAQALVDSDHRPFPGRADWTEEDFERANNSYSCP